MDARRGPYGAGSRRQEVSAHQHGLGRVIIALNLGHVVESDLLAFPQVAQVFST